MSDVTQLIDAIEQGDGQASSELLLLVYDELRHLAAQRLSQERPGQTLQATALVHEAFLRLVDGSANQRWANRGHFFAAAAEAMRRILLNRARDKKRLKRGGDWQRVDLDQIEAACDTDGDHLLALNAALEKTRGRRPALGTDREAAVFCRPDFTRGRRSDGIGSENG